MNSKNYRPGMDDALDTLKTLAHPLRLSLLCSLIDDGEMSAGDLVNRHAALASQSQISQYLNQMRKQDLIHIRRDGHYIYYSLKDRRIQKLVKMLHTLYCQEL